MSFKKPLNHTKQKLISGYYNPGYRAIRGSVDLVCLIQYQSVSLPDSAGPIKNPLTLKFLQPLIILKFMEILCRPSKRPRLSPPPSHHIFLECCRTSTAGRAWPDQSLIWSKSSRFHQILHTPPTPTIATFNLCRFWFDHCAKQPKNDFKENWIEFFKKL